MDDPLRILQFLSEVSRRGNIMSCVYEAEPLSFSCVLSAIGDVRNGTVTADTVRKILKQIDSAVAQFGMPKPVGVSSLSDEEVLTSLEQQCAVKGTLSDLAEYATLIPQLLQFLVIAMNIKTI
mgnify:FL=1